MHYALTPRRLRLLLILQAIFSMLMWLAARADAQRFENHHHCECQQCDVDRHQERLDQRMERYEEHLDRAASRKPWDVWGKVSDALKAHDELEQIRDEESQYLQDRREMLRQQHAYERHHQRRQEFGRTRLMTDFRAEIDQSMEWGNLRIDEDKLLKELEKRNRLQRQREQQRDQQRQQDDARRERLRMEGKNCGACQKCPCDCPEKAPLREPILDAPLKIPMLVDADLELLIARSGYERAQMMRLPPVREPLRADKQPAQKYDYSAPDDQNEPMERSDGLREPGVREATLPPMTPAAVMTTNYFQLRGQPAVR